MVNRKLEIVLLTQSHAKTLQSSHGKDCIASARALGVSGKWSVTLCAYMLPTSTSENLGYMHLLICNGLPFFQLNAAFDNYQISTFHPCFSLSSPLLRLTFV